MQSTVGIVSRALQYRSDHADAFAGNATSYGEAKHVLQAMCCNWYH